jgi:hypothetical protein
MPFLEAHGTSTVMETCSSQHMLRQYIKISMIVNGIFIGRHAFAFVVHS